jgi:SAM-dependent methyltransferase
MLSAPSHDHPDPSLLAALRMASAQYGRGPLHFRFYAWFKYRLDPCYLAVAAHIPPNSFTVDVGTGLGMLPVLLSLWGGQRDSLGIEYDATKARAAAVAAGGLRGVCISQDDALTCELPPCDVVAMVDVLHYYPLEVQRSLLARCARALRPGGRLLLREADRTHRGGAGWTRWLEKQTIKLGWNKASQALFRPIDDIVSDLAGLGFQVRKQAVAGSLYPGNVLLVAEQAA